MKVLAVESVRDVAPDKMKKTNLVETPNLFCDVYCLAPGQAQKIHSHAGADKLYYVLSGTGLFTIGSETRAVDPGHLVPAPAGEDHGVRNESSETLRLLVVMAPNPNV